MSDIRCEKHRGPTHGKLGDACVPCQQELIEELVVALKEIFLMYRLLAGPDDEISQAVIAQAEAALKKGRDDVEIVAT